MQDAASEAEYFPPAQVSHACDPVDATYLPAEQSVQLDWLTEFWNRPDGQLVQLEEPVDGAYWPAKHPSHVVKAPGLAEKKPATQGVHVSAPAALDHVPGGQLLQADAPARRVGASKRICIKSSSIV